MQAANSHDSHRIMTSRLPRHRPLHESRRGAGAREVRLLVPLFALALLAVPRAASAQAGRIEGLFKNVSDVGFYYQDGGMWRRSGIAPRDGAGGSGLGIEFSFGIGARSRERFERRKDPNRCGEHQPAPEQASCIDLDTTLTQVEVHRRSCDATARAASSVGDPDTCRTTLDTTWRYEAKRTPYEVIDTTWLYELAVGYSQQGGFRLRGDRAPGGGSTPEFDGTLRELPSFSLYASWLGLGSPSDPKRRSSAWPERSSPCRMLAYDPVF